MRTFTITDDQEAKFKAWKVEHHKTCDLRSGTIGDLYQIHFTPTGIGDFVHVTCACKAEIDLNDYSTF